MLAIFHVLGCIPFWKHCVNSLERGYSSSAEQVFNTRAGIPSGLVAFDGLNCQRVRSTAAKRKRPSERVCSFRGLTYENGADRSSWPRLHLPPK